MHEHYKELLEKYMQNWPSMEEINSDPESSHGDGDELLVAIAIDFSDATGDDQIRSFLDRYISGIRWYS